MSNKNNNQERIKKVAIIPNTNFYNLVPFIKPCDSTHKATIAEFIYETGIELPVENIYRTSSQELAYGLVCQGFVVLLSTSVNSAINLNIYLPEQLTDEQKQYLNFATSLLNNYALMVFSHNSKEEVFDYQQEASRNTENFTNFVNEFPTYTNPKQTNNNKLVRKPE